MDWQVESCLRSAAFVSSTSADLGDCRRMASSVLLQAGILPIIQDHFGPDGRTLEGMLIDKVLSCDAVICLVAHAFGTAPSEEVGDGRSFTQLEYDLAVRYDKPLYIFVASDEFAASHPVSQSNDHRDRQMRHRQAILQGAHKYEVFSSPAQLERLLLALVRPLSENSRRRAFQYIHSPALPSCFVGRVDELAQLNKCLDARSPAVVTLLGMGGQGKTTLLAHTLRQREVLPFAAGLWVSAEFDGYGFSEFLDAALITFMGERFRKLDMPHVGARVQRLLRLMQARPLLIVIDAIERWLRGWAGRASIEGFHDLSLRQGVSEELDGFLRQASGLDNGSHLVLTGRVLPSALDAVSCAIVPVLPPSSSETGLQGLGAEAAAQLLDSLGVKAPPEKLREVARLLVCHPLAITGFARIAHRTGPHWESLLARTGRDPSGMLGAVLDQMRRHLPDRERSEAIMRIAAVLPEGTPIALLHWLMRPSTPSASEPDLLPHVLALADWNLLVWDSPTITVRLHALVAEYFAKLVSPQETQFIHSRAASWFEQQAAVACQPDDWSRNVLYASRHLVAAGDSLAALRMLLTTSRFGCTLVDRMITCGHLCECAEAIELVRSSSRGLQEVDCILARARVHAELEISHQSLIDLERATEIISKGTEPMLVSTQVALAQCFAYRGLIHIESGKTSNAIPLLDVAASLFLHVVNHSPEATIHYAKTITNRGLARSHIGQWDEAESDYRVATEILQRVGNEHNGEATAIARDIETRHAALLLERGRAEAAARALEPIVCQCPARGAQTVLNKHDLSSRVYLAAAYTGCGNPIACLEVTEPLVAALEELSITGNRRFDGILALALINQAEALLDLGRVVEAERASDRAVSLYDDLIAGGSFQFGAQRGNALFRRAEARVRGQKPGPGRLDYALAIAIARAWIRDWSEECDVVVVFSTNAIRATRFIPEGFNAEAREMIEVLRECWAIVTGRRAMVAASVHCHDMILANRGRISALAERFGTIWQGEGP